ncbi:hypothetical protein [Flammeovirga pacifica]|uniref:YokE-like PH domain-containing protein n=1 Tax=Flammeovirga pacifica TaxID=915059 RepID=A0A1S1Z4F4_FLAPC|nr:hypothetical protein [Flammeovirga pacifica]OHX68166.1 hypothetical protein NH26_18345 [Flammeovirga pacifica]
MSLKQDEWEKHFEDLEMKTFGKNALIVMRDQSIQLLQKISSEPKAIKGGMWASLQTKEPLFGGLFLLNDQMVFIGGTPKESQLKTFEWNWGNITKFDKLEDTKLGITKFLDMNIGGQKLRISGLKGFVPLSFILILEKIWFDQLSNN